MGPDLLARLSPRISVTADGCWDWTGARTGSGYGEVMVAGRMTYVHRVLYDLMRGPIAAGMELDHLCRNRACCNPEHLEAVTHAENMRRAGLARTTCVAGHPRTPENTFVQPSGWKACVVCRRERERKARAEGRRR